MPDNQTNGQQAPIEKFAVWFEDASAVPFREGCVRPSQGIPKLWLTALLGEAKLVETHCHTSDNSIVSGALVEVPVAASTQFTHTLYNACTLLGTCAWIRPYGGPNDPDKGYVAAWKDFAPLKR